MKRVSVLRKGTGDQHHALLEQLREKLLPMLAQQADCYRQSVVPGLAKHGLLLRHWDELTARQREEASDYFDSSVSAALTPLVIDPEHPFPFLSNLSTSLTFRLQDPERHELMNARVKVLDVCLRDRRQAWILENTGKYSRLEPDEHSDGPEAIGTDETLMKLTRDRAGAC